MATPLYQRIDSRDKVKYLKNYVGSLKANCEINMFFGVNFEEIGLFDFEYITRNRLKFSDIEKNLKDNKYEDIKMFCEDLRNQVASISEYLLLNDPLQAKCHLAYQNINNFQNTFMDEFKENKQLKNQTKLQKKQDKKQKDDKKEKNIQPPLQLKKSTFSEKLEMFYYLQAHEDNPQYVRFIGEAYNIGKQTQEGYSIKLEFNAQSPWLELLHKKVQ